MKDFNLDEIKSIITLCKENSIKRFKYDIFEVEFGDKITTEFKIDKEIAGLDKEKMPDEEDFLYASSGYNPKAERALEQALEDKK